MSISPYRVLFLSQRDTARSIIAEAIMNQKGAGRFTAFSAGVAPGDKADPVALRALARAGYDPSDLKPQSYTVFAGDEPMDFVFTLSDTARGEPMPEWPGQPVTAHWACEDPLLVEEDPVEIALVYARMLGGLERRIETFMQLPFQSLDRISLTSHVDAIGKT
jgi:protein-tyrosine-phosphatase